MQGRARNDGVEIAYSAAGEGSTVLLISGLGGSAARWGTEFPGALAKRHRVLMMDNRGTGASTKPDADWTLDDMASDAVAVLDSVGAVRAHVVGISMGGMIAQLMALDHADRVDRLVLVSTHFGGAKIELPTQEAMVALAPPRGTPPDAITRSAMRAITAPGFADEHPEVIEALVRITLAQPTPFRAFSRQVQAIVSSDRSQSVSRITAPTLVVHGDLDPLIPVGNGRRLAERIPGARLEVLRGVGHVPMWEAPQRLAAVVLAFSS